MTDSKAVWPPGFRVTDSAGNPVSGAMLEFFDAGTNDTQSVYSDAALANSLGAIVYCDSEGAPVSASGGSTRVAVHVGSDPYKVVIKDGDGAVLETKDGLSGAIDTAPFAAASEAIPTYPVVIKSNSYTVVPGDQGNVINVDCTGGNRTITLPSAVTAADNWSVIIRHVGSANKVILATVAAQTISLPLAGGAASSFEMLSYGETLHIASDGANWHVVGGMLGLKLGGGYHTEVYDNGTLTGGTFTPDPEEGNLQKAINGGAFTLGPPAENTSVVLQITNNASAGAVDISAFDKVTGDNIAITNAYVYKCYINVIDSVSHLSVVGMQ